ncbi:MAG: hypothetical protein CVV64_13520 [Candidatus Wallbacteria bacterium HGW-Wallbacteria-1]|jgi:SAM-dependent methyltransferase|uniref:Methyltransferase type 11 domain-containing protein n=1 Tax=Candidatus Wallbacteria bacterium HGW-Wallbacteria-1 TaxID=2013854 RepID=A0A2N1PMS8_9BACT|nr:MAG: hypothetical protein CVV64_13520 [Candidatus Wallbacteria bacterium HGW-Wallbacteria-1]
MIDSAAYQNHLSAIRRIELASLLPFLPENGRILEIGAGTGEQARLLSSLGFRVEAVDLTSSAYSRHRVFPVIEYDGINLPWDDQSFDCVFSSNVLEHVTEIEALMEEVSRVLKPSGHCVHAVPTAQWRLLTIITSVMAIPSRALEKAKSIAESKLKARASHTDDQVHITDDAVCETADTISETQSVHEHWLFELMGKVFPAHGNSGNAFSELRTFSSSSWQSLFRKMGWNVLQIQGCGLLYSGQVLLGSSLPLTARRVAAKMIGSSCHIFKLKPMHTWMHPSKPHSIRRFTKQNSPLQQYDNIIKEDEINSNAIKVDGITGNGITGDGTNGDGINYD